MSEASSKAEWRELLAARVAALEAGQREECDHRIVALLAEFEEYRRARQLLAYRALSDEVCLDGLFSAARADGKSIWLPIVTEDFSLEYGRWDPGEPLARSVLGVEQPLGGPGPADDAPSLVLVPGRGFDRRGYRLGRGRGCYDRSLERWRRLGPAVGLGYSCQLVDRLPVDEHDQPVDMIVTERGVLRPRAGANGEREQGGVD